MAMFKLSFLFSRVLNLPIILMYLLLQSAEALASQVSQEDFDRGLIYPPFTNIRKISAHIAASVAAKAYELGEPSTSFPFPNLSKSCDLLIILPFQILSYRFGHSPPSTKRSGEIC